MNKPDYKIYRYRPPDVVEVWSCNREQDIKWTGHLENYGGDSVQSAHVDNTEGVDSNEYSQHYTHI